MVPGKSRYSSSTVHPSYSLTHIHMQVRRPSNTSIILIHSYTVYICKWGVHQIHPSYSSTHIHMQVRRSSNTFIILIHSYTYASEAFIKYIHHTHPLIYICKWGVHQIHPSYSSTPIHMQVRRSSNTSIILIHSYTYASEAFIKYIHHTHPLIYICKWGVHQIHPSYSSTHIHMQVRRPPWSSCMSMTSQVEVLEFYSNSGTDPNWCWLPSFHQGLCGKRDWSTLLKITSLPQLHLHVGKFVSYLRQLPTKVGGFPQVFWFSLPAKLTALIWPQMLKKAFNTIGGQIK